MKIGDAVKITNNRPTAWFPKNNYPVELTGIVLKVFKNGKVSVQIDQLKGHRNQIQNFTLENFLK